MSDSPTSSMFMANRDAKCSRPRWSLAGQEVFSQRQQGVRGARHDAPCSVSTQVNGATPVLTSILGLAPSAYRRISRELALAPFPGSCGVEFQANRSGRGRCARTN